MRWSVEHGPFVRPLFILFTSSSLRLCQENKEPAPSILAGLLPHDLGLSRGPRPAAFAASGWFCPAVKVCGRSHARVGFVVGLLKADLGWHSRVPYKNTPCFQSSGFVLRYTDWLSRKVPIPQIEIEPKPIIVSSEWVHNCDYWWGDLPIIARRRQKWQLFMAKRKIRTWNCKHPDTNDGWQQQCNPYENCFRTLCGNKVRLLHLL